jgi:hypothetical protein
MHRARLVVDRTEQCCGVCLPSPTWTGSAACSLGSIVSRSAIARRHCTRPRLTSIFGPPCGAKEFPVATIRARAILRRTPATPSHQPLAYRLRKLRELQDPGSGRPAPGLEIGITLAETAETPWRSPASNQRISNLFNAGKPQTPANGAYLFRPSASQSSDRDAQVGMFKIEVFARGHARFGGAVSRPSRSAVRPALSAWPAWHPPRPARSSSAQGTAWPAPGSARHPCRRPRRAWRTSAPAD